MMLKKEVVTKTLKELEVGDILVSSKDGLKYEVDSITTDGNDQGYIENTGYVNGSFFYFKGIGNIKDKLMKKFFEHNLDGFIIGE